MSKVVRIILRIVTFGLSYFVDHHSEVKDEKKKE
jgi:hypothetical protein